MTGAKDARVPDWDWTPQELEELAARAAEFGGVPGFEAQADPGTGNLLLIEDNPIFLRFKALDLSLDGGSGPKRLLGAEVLDWVGDPVFSLAVARDDIRRGMDMSRCDRG
jgi:hypothetical protein